MVARPGASDGPRAARDISLSGIDAAATRQDGSLLSVLGIDTQLQAMSEALAAQGSVDFDSGTQHAMGGLYTAGAQAAARSSTPTPHVLQAASAPDGQGDEPDSRFATLATPSVGGGLIVSASLLLWVLRAGGLMAAMMASVPAWRSLDPLPILNQPGRKREDVAQGGEEEPDADANANWQGAALADRWQDAPASHSAEGRRVLIEALEDTR